MATACRPMPPAASIGKAQDEDGEYLLIAARVCFGRHHCGTRERRRLRSRARTAVASRHHRAQERRRLSGDGGARRLHGQAGPQARSAPFSERRHCVARAAGGRTRKLQGGAATAIIAAARNADVKIIGCHWQTVVHSVFARAEFKGPQDLKGATMAISAPNATPDMIGRAYLAQNNVPASEVKFASLGNDPERYKALLGGIALATVISIEFLPIGKTDGIKLIARGGDVMPKYLRLCAVTTGKLLDARREDAVRFLTAQMQGYGYALANRDEELRITREIAGIKATDPRPEFMFAEAARADTGIDPKMPIPMDKLEWLQEQLVKAGNLSQPFDVSRVVNGDVRAQALARAELPQ